MDNFITFDQAVEFLSTTRSTLYKWLREDKVPAHKLGRQWRFVREELEQFLAGQGQRQPRVRDLEELARLVQNRNPRANKENKMSVITPTVAAAAEQVIWDAVDQRASDIHIQPNDVNYEILYRVNKGLTQVITLDKSTVQALDQEWRSRSQTWKTEDSRRLFVGRSHGDTRDELQIHYQRLQTLAGPHIMLKINNISSYVYDMEKICPDTKTLNTLRRWCKRPYGLVLITGGPISGKTTTYYSCMQESIRHNKESVFTLEDPVHVRIPGANQLEINFEDAAAYKAAMAAIYASDLDALFLGSGIGPGATSQPLSLIYSTALEVAKTGHRVFLHLMADSPDDALAQVNMHLQEKIDPYIIGVSWQRLLVKPDGKGSQVEYQLKSGKLDQ